MKKVFTLFAAVLMVGSMMAERTDRQMVANNLSMKNLLNANGQKAVAANYARTRTAEQSTNVLNISYESQLSVLNITATNDDPYLFFIEPVAWYMEQRSDYETASLLAELNFWIPKMQSAGVINFCSAKGNATLNPEEKYLFSGGMVVGTEYVVIAVPYADGAINGTPVCTTYTYVAPTMPTSYADLTFDDALFDNTYLYSNDIAHVKGANADSTLLFGIMYYANDVAAADYSVDSPYDAALRFIDGTDTTKINARAYADLSVTTTDNENYTLTSHFLGMDGVGYFVTMNFTIAPPDTVVVTFNPYTYESTDFGWIDYTAILGWWQYSGTNSDESLYVELSNGNVVLQAAGTYTIDDMDQDFTYIDDIAASQRYRFLSLTVVVSENDGVITITAEGLCRNGIYYVMTCNTVITPTALENATSTVKAQKRIENGQMVIIKNGVRYNLMGAEF